MKKLFASPNKKSQSNNARRKAFQNKNEKEEFRFLQKVRLASFPISPRGITPIFQATRKQQQAQQDPPEKEVNLWRGCDPPLKDTPYHKLLGWILTFPGHIPKMVGSTPIRQPEPWRWFLGGLDQHPIFEVDPTPAGCVGSNPRTNSLQLLPLQKVRLASGSLLITFKHAKPNTTTNRWQILRGPMLQFWAEKKRFIFQKSSSEVSK